MKHENTIHQQYSICDNHIIILFIQHEHSIKIPYNNYFNACTQHLD